VVWIEGDEGFRGLTCVFPFVFEVFFQLKEEMA
jgi:hypothetical protein